MITINRKILLKNVNEIRLNRSLKEKHEKTIDISTNKENGTLNISTGFIRNEIEYPNLFICIKNIKATIIENIKFSVNISLFYNLLKEIKRDYVKLVLKGKNILIEEDENNYTLLDLIKYNNPFTFFNPNTECNYNFNIKGNKLLPLLNIFLKNIKYENYRKAFELLYFDFDEKEILNITGTNAEILFNYKTQNTSNVNNFGIHLDVAHSLKRILKTNDIVHFKIDKLVNEIRVNDISFYFYAEQPKFPNYKNLLKNDYKHIVKINRKKLIECIKKCYFINERYDYEKNGIYIKISENQICLKDDKLRSKTNIPVEYNDTFYMYVDIEKILKVLDMFISHYIILNYNNLDEAITFSDNTNFRCLLMPLTIKLKDIKNKFKNNDNSI